MNLRPLIIIIVNFHWGIEREYVPNDTQKTLAHLAVDEGADLVIGHHPHVLLATAAPAAAMVTQLAQLYNKDVKYASVINVMSVIFCIVTMPELPLQEEQPLICILHPDVSPSVQGFQNQ